jgi:fatty-acyl-CoA synthase
VDQIGRVLQLAALQQPERPALKTTDGLCRTYAQLDDRTSRLANALVGMGFRQGERVAAWSSTCPQYLELYLAVAKAGLVLVPVNAMFTEHEAAYQLEDSGAVAMFCSTEKDADARELGQRTKLRRVISFGDWHDSDSEYERLLRTGAATSLPDPDEDALYVLSYTSGTTGRPKGAMVTHRTMKNTMRVNAHSYRTPQGSVLLYHANMSFVATVLALLLGHIFVRGTIVMLTPVAGPESVIAAIGREKANFTFIPSPWIGPMTDLVARHPENWRHMRSVVHSASKAPAEQLKRWRDAIGHCYLEGWGMTEGSGSLFTVTSADDATTGSDAKDFYASVGRPALDVVVRVIDEDGNELPHDGESVGELVVSSPTLVVGYWNNAEATRKSFRDGWFYSGDLGAIDAGGYVYIAERRTDLIISGGMNIYPSELENCIGALDGVAEVSVVGLPHERWGETPVAFVVTAGGAIVTEEQILRHCATYLARYKHPSEVRFLDALPRNASQKVLRRVLRENVEPAR